MSKAGRRSMRTVSTPRWAKAVAAVSPPTPPPTTRTRRIWLIECDIPQRQRSNPKEPRLDGVVLPQLLRPRRINHPAFADHVQEVDQLERERSVLLDEEDGQTLL